MKSFFIVALILLTLGGCSTQPSPDDSYLPQDAWIVDCKKSEPPNKEAFMKADDISKLYMMTGAFNNQTKNIDECNVRLKNIRAWKEREKNKTQK